MSIEFNGITKNDLKEIMELYNWYVSNTDVSFHIAPLPIEEIEQMVFPRSPRFTTFTISLNNTFCGYIVLAEYKKREAYNITGEVSVYLKKEYTAKGIGSKALKFIEEHAVKNNFHSLIATISGNNISSIKLFRKNAYVQCAHYKEVGKKFDKILDVFAFQKML